MMFINIETHINIYMVRQSKMSQSENHDIYVVQEYFNTKFSLFIQ